MNTLIKNGIYNTAKSVSTLLFPLLTYSYVAHVLYADGLGKVEFAKSYTTYFVMLAMLGIVNYATREVAKIRGNKEKLSVFVREILIVNFISVIFSLILFFLSIHLIGHLTGYKCFMYINSISVLLTALGMEWLFAGLEEYRYIALRTILFQVMSFLLVIFFVHNQRDIYIYVAIQVFSVGGANLMNFFCARKFIDFRMFCKLELRKHIKPILLLFGMTVCVQIFSYMDVTMLSFMKDDNVVGLYSVAMKVTNVLCSMLVAFTAVLTPRIALYESRDEWGNIRRVSYKAIEVIIMLALPASVGLGILAPQIIIIFSGHSFLPAVMATRILAIRVLLSPLNSFIIVQFFIPIGKEKYNLYSTGVAAILNIFLNFFLIPLFSLNGAAIATICAEIIELIINIYFFKKYISLKRLIYPMIRYFSGTMLIIVLAVVLKFWIEQTWMYMIILIVSSVIVYFGWLLCWRDKLIIEVLHRIKNV